MSIVHAPRPWIESISHLRLPALSDSRLQELMDHNTEGQLTPAERKDLQALGEMSEILSLVRAEALQLLGTKPQ